MSVQTDQYLMNGRFVESNIKFSILISVLNFHRSIILKSYEDGKNLHESEVNLKLKPELWFNYILLSNRRVTVRYFVVFLQPRIIFKK